MTIHFTADRGDTRLRLDQVLVRRVSEVSGMSRAQAQRWIAGGLVSVDAVRAPRSSIHVREGAAIEVTLPASARVREAPQPEAVPLDVLYEDEDLMAVNKPAGMVVHPSFRNMSGTVLNGVLWRLRDRSPLVSPGLVSRLDKDTSGVLLIALSNGAHACIQRDARAGLVRKEYLAIVRGTPNPPIGSITLPLRHDPNDRRRIIVAADGVPSQTRYEVVGGAGGARRAGRASETSRASGASGASRASRAGETDGDLALVRCELVTGRTHQIRVHMASSGWPIIGDRVYGAPDERIARQALHACRITMVHPITRQPLLLNAPLPPDMAELVSTKD